MKIFPKFDRAVSSSGALSFVFRELSAILFLLGKSINLLHHPVMLVMLIIKIITVTLFLLLADFARVALSLRSSNSDYINATFVDVSFDCLCKAGVSTQHESQHFSVRH